MDGKTKAIVAHITYIGWIIALVVNMNEKDEIASFYIRQLLGIYLFSLIIAFIPVINIFGWIPSPGKDHCSSLKRFLCEFE